MLTAGLSCTHLLSLFLGFGSQLQSEVCVDDDLTAYLGDSTVDDAAALDTVGSRDAAPEGIGNTLDAID